MEEETAFYGRGFERVLKLVKDADEKACDALLNDPAVRGILLIHGLHPVPLETRLHQALEKVRPYMKSHGGNVELVSLILDVAKLRLQGHCESCPSSTVTLELAVRQAIEEACPDLMGFEVENAFVVEPKHQPNAAPAWEEVGRAEMLNGGGMLPVHAAGIPLVLCKVGEDLYAYRDHCPACNMPLHLGALNGATLGCQLGHRYDIRMAGRRLDGEGHLDPMPLLVTEGAVRVAVRRESTQTGIAHA
jgi:Fe-S cluster biogenesis protein NfuA/nitrite reductase/ring-hydroxylating ferredoxin subunit